MCLALQWRAFLRHPHCQNSSGREMFLVFSKWQCEIFDLSSGQMALSAPAALASLLFDPPEAQKTSKFEKHSAWRRVYLLARLRLLSSAFLFSDSSHLCFPCVHIVGILTSKFLLVINPALPNSRLQGSTVPALRFLPIKGLKPNGRSSNFHWFHHAALANTEKQDETIH